MNCACNNATRACVAAFVLLVVGAPGGRADQSITQPYPGLTYIDRTDTTPRRIHLHVLQIDLGAPDVRFKLSPPAGAKEVVRETTVDFLRKAHAQAAINAHYFVPFPSTDAEVDVIGVAASDGHTYSSFETPAQRYALLIDAPGLNIDRQNRASIVRKGDGAALWNALSGSAQVVTDGAVTVPVYRDDARPAGALEPGGPNNYSNAKSWYDATNARTAIGLSRDSRTMTWFTVDARGDSLGLNVREMAEVLVRDFGVWNGLNLDGGGSTSMAMEDPVTHQPHLVNTSSDNPNGRAVGSSLAVFASHVHVAAGLQSRGRPPD